MLTLPFIVGMAAMVVADAVGFAMGDKNSELGLTSVNEEVYSLQQQLEEQESELQTQINELKGKNLETHRENLKSNQAVATVYNCKRVPDWLNVRNARGYIPAETGARPTSRGSLNIGRFYDFEKSGGEIVILVSKQTNESDSGGHRNGNKTGYLESLQINRVQLNVWISDSGPWADAEKKATDIAEKVSSAAELSKRQDTKGQ